MLKVYIEESAFAAARPLEVADDAAVSDLVPALVQELALPTRDHYGNHLTYVLRHADDGWVIPGFSSLSAAQIEPGTHLSLVSYVADDATMLPPPSSSDYNREPAFYAEQTLANPEDFLDVAYDQSALPSSVQPASGKRSWSRRGFLLAGSVAVLGTVGLGLGYAASRTLLKGHPAVKTQLAAMATQPTSGAVHASPTARPFQPAKATMQLAFTQHQRTVRAVAWSPDGKTLASAGNDQSVLIWNTMGQTQFTLQQNATIQALAWSPDSQQLAAAPGKQVLFLDARTGKVAKLATRPHTANIMALAWSGQRLVSAGLDKRAVVWNTQNFQPLTTFTLHTSGILGVSWQADGQTVGSSSQGGVIRVWNSTSAQEVHGFLMDGAVPLNALAFQPGGNMLVAGGQDGVIRLWQNGLVCQVEGNGKNKGQCMDQPQHLNGHKGAIDALAWSPDGHLLATADAQGQLFIWSLQQSQLPLVKIVQNDPILSVSWSADSRSIAIAAGKTVTLWSLA